jgi:predicted ABC-class ATPase
VAFVADGSILPRKSGASSLPMASPPAISFQAPQDSTTRRDITIEMSTLANYLPSGAFTTSETKVTFTGLVVPAGITLICGGGYHGKVRKYFYCYYGLMMFV